MKAVLPCSADAARAPFCPTLSAAANPSAIIHIRITAPSTRLRHDIDQRRLAGLDHLHRLFERWRKFTWFGYRTGRPHPHRTRQLAVVDGRIFETRADRTYVVAKAGDAVAAVRHALNVHHLLMIAAIIVHHRQQWNLVPCRGPQHAGRIHEVAVRLEIDRERSEER